MVLVIPDFFERAYVQAMGTMLLQTMGFKQLCAQQVIYSSLLTVSALTMCLAEGIAGSDIRRGDLEWLCRGYGCIHDQHSLRR